MLIDDAGRFDLRGTYTNSAFGGGTGSVRLRGRIVETHLRVVFTFPRDSTPAWEDTEAILEENRTPEFTIACAL